MDQTIRTPENTQTSAPNYSQNIAIYPGTFDPITLGHWDMVSRATRIFSKVIIAVAANTGKKPLFSLEQRIAMIRASTQNLPSVQTLGFEGLLVDLAKQQQAVVIIRGVRSMGDFDYEMQLAQMNRRLMPELETLFLPPSAELQMLSSTFVREIATMGGDVSQLVPKEVLPWLHSCS